MSSAWAIWPMLSTCFKPLYGTSSTRDVYRKKARRSTGHPSLLVARNVAPARVALGELDFDGETVLPTVDRAVEIWTKQWQTCIEHGVELSPTRFGSMIAVSPQALEGSKPIEGVRYEPTNVMSGWWLFTAEYDGTVDNFESMKPVHTFDVLRET